MPQNGQANQAVKETLESIENPKLSDSCGRYSICLLIALSTTLITGRTFSSTIEPFQVRSRGIDN